MEQKPRPQSAAEDSRDDRLKAALKANLARRKAQTRARAEDQELADPGKGNQKAGQTGPSEQG